MKPPIINNEQFYQPLSYSVDYIFPTPFLRGGLKLPHETVARDCESLIDIIKQFEEDPRRYYTTYFFEHQRQDMHRFPWYDDFANQIKDTYIEFIKHQWHMEVSHLSRHDIHLFSWVSVWEEGLEHSAHNHQDSIISGTYYPVNDGGQPIEFHSPNIQSQFSWGSKVEEMKQDHMPNTVAMGQTGSHQRIVITPTQGECFMWPSNIFHSISPKDGDFRRVAISFNLKHNNPISDNEQGTELSYEFL